MHAARALSPLPPSNMQLKPNAHSFRNRHIQFSGGCNLLFLCHYRAEHLGLRPSGICAMGGLEPCWFRLVGESDPTESNFHGASNPDGSDSLRYQISQFLILKRYQTLQDYSSKSLMPSRIRSCSVRVSALGSKK